MDYRKGSKDLSPKRILDDESAVIKCCDSINNWKNPFEGSNSLFCLYYGIVACHEEEMRRVLDGDDLKAFLQRR